MVEEGIVALTKGSRYRIESVETRERAKVTKGVFTFVAIDDKGRKRPVPPL